jgi:hypothetical protein
VSKQILIDRMVRRVPGNERLDLGIGRAGSALEEFAEGKGDVGYVPAARALIEVEHVDGALTPDEIVELDVAVDEPKGGAVHR